jgi:DNA polymerase III epsilon subunit-like protein
MTETLISVDIEASGPIPGRYSMLSLGACPVENPADGFYVEIQPTSDEAVPEAIVVSGLDIARLRSEGVAPAEAMRRLSIWISRFDGPVFVGFNASFDWSFVNYYFVEYGPNGRNPFGIGALDIKAYAMGRLNTSWDETRSSRLAARLGEPDESTHHALEDARHQARLFRAIRSIPATQPFSSG